MYFTLFSSGSTVDFEQVNFSWVIYFLLSQLDREIFCLQNVFFYLIILITSSLALIDTSHFRTPWRSSQDLQKQMMESFVKIVEGFHPLTIAVKRSIFDVNVCRGRGYTSALVNPLSFSSSLICSFISCNCWTALRLFPFLRLLLL